MKHRYRIEYNYEVFLWFIYPKNVFETCKSLSKYKKQYLCNEKKILEAIVKILIIFKNKSIFGSI